MRWLLGCSLSFLSRELRRKGSFVILKSVLEGLSEGREAGFYLLSQVILCLSQGPAGSWYGYTVYSEIADKQGRCHHEPGADPPSPPNPCSLFSLSPTHTHTFGARGVPAVPGFPRPGVGTDGKAVSPEIP